MRFNKCSNLSFVGCTVIGVIIGLFLLIFSPFYIINPGERGIKITLGNLSTEVLKEGVGFKLPLISSVKKMSIQQRGDELVAAAFSSDLQQVRATLKIIYRIPENQILNIYRNYSGKPWDSFISPRVLEAVKEVTALHSAEEIVKKRENIKLATLDAARKKLNSLVIIEDVVIENLKLSEVLETAIEQKMVREQEAAKAKFTKEKAIIDAETAIIVAQGEAAAIKTRGEAIAKNPGVVDLMIAEKWNGVSPLVIGSGSNILLPINKK